MPTDDKGKTMNETGTPQPGPKGDDGDAPVQPLEWLASADSSALFVGGCDDGKLREIPHNASYHRWRSIDNHGGEQIYRKELIGAPGKTWRLYVLESLDLVTAMSMILDAYAHRPNAERSGPAAQDEL